MQKRLFTVDQVADLLGAHPPEVQQWIRQGWLAVQSLPDGSTRISERGLIRFLKDRGIDLGQLAASTMRGAWRDDDDLADDAAAREMLTGTYVPVSDEESPQVPPLEAGGAAADRAEPASGEPAGAPLAAGARPEDPEVAAEEAQEAEEAAEAEEAQAPAVALYDADAAEDAAEAPAPAAAQEEPPVPEQPLEQEQPPADVAAQVAEAILQDAVERGASHIHLEPRPEGLTLRLRVDGLLRDKPSFHRRLPDGLAGRLVGHLLVLSGLADADAARPRAGRFTCDVGGRMVAFDLSVFPTTAGPRLVLAVHDREVPAPDLSQLALAGEVQRRLEQALSACGGGLVVAAAMPRAGMETALRALAGAVGVAGCGMLAVEAPGGVEIAGACRSQTDPLAGYTFAAAARGLIAQDADAIVLGRLGDPVTMAAAVEAALAGGLVVGAVRSADAAEGLACLAEMAPEPWALASVLRAVVACRTVRRLCRACRKAVHSPEQPPPEIGMAREQLGTKLYRAVGCDRCGQTGYDGTIPLAAVVIPDRPVVALIRDRAGRDAFAAACRDAGAPSFTQLAAERLRAGETSLEEIARAL